MARSKENLALKIGGGQPAHPDGVAGGRGGRHPQRVLGDSHSPGPSDLIGTGTRNRFEISTWSTVGSSTKEAGGVGGVEPRKTKKGTEKHKTAKKGNTAESRMFCSFKHLGATKMSKLQSGKTYANKWRNFKNAQKLTKIWSRENSRLKCGILLAEIISQQNLKTCQEKSQKR